jgi:hypothetical protein
VQRGLEIAKLQVWNYIKFIQILGLAGLGVTGIDIYKNGLNWSNGTDVVMGAVGFIPVVGWAISGAYFIANFVVEEETGESIGQHLGEAVRNTTN